MEDPQQAVYANLQKASTLNASTPMLQNIIPNNNNNNTTNNNPPGPSVVSVNNGTPADVSNMGAILSDYQSL